MDVSGAKELFRGLAKRHFDGYTVVWANQSRMVKPRIPLVVLTPGNVKRPQASVYRVEDGEPVGYYPSTFPITIDLFTNGRAVMEGGEAVAYENTALDEMTGFADRVNSVTAVQWCHANNIALLIDGDAQDISGLVNDDNYEYRSRMTVKLYYMHSTLSTIGKEDTGSFEDTVAVDGGAV